MVRPRISSGGFLMSSIWVIILVGFVVAVVSRAVAAGLKGQPPFNADRLKSGDREPGAKPTFDPTDNYDVRLIEGWTVLVNKSFLAEQQTLAAESLMLLRDQLAQVVRRVPAEAVTKLRTIRIWVEQNEPHHPCMTYHPNMEWLKEHGMNPDKARCVEVSNARNFLKWVKQQPWMVLHELSHGYHHQFVEGGFENAEIKAAFERAMKARLYDAVSRNNGQKEKAYAATDPKEFFAEASEAYFGTNDFYPFVSADLRQHDRQTFELLKTLWHDD